MCSGVALARGGGREREREGEARPVGLVGCILERLDVLLVVVLVEALHLPGVTLLDPALERGVVLPLEPLQERGLELADTSAAGGRVEAMRLLEGVEAAFGGKILLVLLE